MHTVIDYQTYVSLESGSGMMHTTILDLTVFFDMVLDNALQKEEVVTEQQYLVIHNKRVSGSLDRVRQHLWYS